MRRILAEWKMVQAQGLALGESFDSARGNSSDTFRLKVSLTSMVATSVPIIFAPDMCNMLLRSSPQKTICSCNEPAPLGFMADLNRQSHLASVSSVVQEQCILGLAGRLPVRMYLSA